MSRNNKYSRRQIFAFCCFFSWVQIICAQNDSQLTVGWLKTINTGKSSVISQMSSFISAPFVYYFTEDDWDSEERVLKIYSINTENERKDSFEISLPQSIVINMLPDIAVSDNYLILCDDEYFTFYRYKKTNGKFIYSNKITLPPNSAGRYMRVIEKDKFLIYTIYNFHNEQKLFNANIGVYDAKNDKIVKFIHPDLPCIGFSHLPYSWVTVNDKNIAIANPCGYKIRFYDFNLEIVDSIDYRPETGWKDLPDNKIPVETDPSKIHPKILIDQLQLLQDTISRIEKIFYLNNSTLMVSSLCIKCGKIKRRIDFWETGNIKKPVYTNLEYQIKYLETDTINLNNVPMSLYYKLNFDIIKNINITVNDDDFFPDHNIPIKEFNHLKNLHYEKHDPNFSIGVYRINFP